MSRPTFEKIFSFQAEKWAGLLSKQLEYLKSEKKFFVEKYFFFTFYERISFFNGKHGYFTTFDQRKSLHSHICSKVFLQVSLISKLLYFPHTCFLLSSVHVCAAMKRPGTSIPRPVPYKGCKLLTVFNSESVPTVSLWNALTFFLSVNKAELWMTKMM